MIDLDYLSKKNFHERDNSISFDEGPHIYTINGDSQYTSVTTWNHTHFEEFNADKIINNMMRSKNWPNSEYYGMTKEEIKIQWDKNRDEAASAGTKLHYDIECFYNNNIVNNESTEYKYFKEFYNDFKHLKPYRTEWMIWDNILRLAGSIDMVFENEDGEWEIYDWKRCKEIKTMASYGKKAKTKCISHIYDCNFFHYSLQLNTYKAILEKNYNIKIAKMCLVCLHPNNKNNSYLRYEVPDLSEEIKLLFDYRLQQITNPTQLKISELKNEQKNLLEKCKKYQNTIDKYYNKISTIQTQLSLLECNDKEETENIEVSVFNIDDIDYLVDPNTHRIYNEDGVYIGNWMNNKPYINSK